MRNRMIILMSALTFVAGAGCGCKCKEAVKPSISVAEGVSEGEDRVERSNVVTVTAIVEKVDVANRLVTLRGPEGKVTTIEVDEAVKNLPQVRKGDEVVVAYYESLAFQVRKPGEAIPGDAALVEGGEAAALGQKPGAIGARALTVVTTVEAIDKVNGTITLKGPEGESKTIKAQNPANLDKVMVGDMIEITYTEAVAISVEKP